MTVTVAVDLLSFPSSAAHTSPALQFEARPGRDECDAMTVPTKCAQQPTLLGTSCDARRRRSRGHYFIGAAQHPDRRDRLASQLRRWPNFHSAMRSQRWEHVDDMT